MQTYQQIKNGHKSKTSFLEDYCDGEIFATHPLFSLHSNALQIFLYFDELEVCNPLGSKTKIHKLGNRAKRFVVWLFFISGAARAEI